MVIPELLLIVFQFLPLKSLLAARSVNKVWRILVSMTPMTPERRALYNLYFTAVASPAFLASRTLVLANLVPFNRVGFIAHIERSEGTILPHEFRCWILEWPEKAVFGWSWPGLDSLFNQDDASWRPYGSNSLRPLITTLADLDPLELHEKDSNETTLSRGLHIWYHGYISITYLVVDDRQPHLHGTVHFIDRMESKTWQTATSWVAWLEASLDRGNRKHSQSLRLKEVEILSESLKFRDGHC